MSVVPPPMVYKRGVVMTPCGRRSVPYAEYVGGGHCTENLSSTEGRANCKIDFVYMLTYPDNSVRIHCENNVRKFETIKKVE